MPLNTNHGPLGSQWGEHDICPIGFKNFPNFVQSSMKYAVDFGRGNSHIPDEEANPRNSLMQLLLGSFDMLLGFTSDEDVVRVTASSVWRRVTVHGGEQWRKINSGAGRGLDQLNMLSVTATHQRVQGHFEFSAVNNTAKLLHWLASPPWDNCIHRGGGV